MVLVLCILACLYVCVLACWDHITYAQLGEAEELSRDAVLWRCGDGDTYPAQQIIASGMDD